MAVKTAASRMEAAVKPTGRTYRGISEVGDGDRCPIEGHGRMYVLQGGGEWCPNQSHDAEKVKRNG